MDVQIIGAGLLLFVALIGVNDPSLPAWSAPMAAAFIGSLISAFARGLRGFLKTWPAWIFAIICGISFGWYAGHAAAGVLDLNMDGVLFPIYVCALLGARAVAYIATDLDIAGIVDGIVNRVKGPK